MKNILIDMKSLADLAMRIYTDREKTGIANLSADQLKAMIEKYFFS